MTDKQHAHALLDRIPVDQVPAAVRFLEFLLIDRVARTAALAPPDDEPVTAEDRARLEHREKGVPMEDVLADFGLTPADFPAGK